MLDSKQGGRLEDMAPTGTSIPGDAGVQRLIPSAPNSHQQEPYQTAGADIAGAADNPTDIPRSTADRVGATSEVVTGKRFGRLLAKSRSCRLMHEMPMAIPCRQRPKRKDYRCRLVTWIMLKDTGGTRSIFVRM